MTDDRVSQCRTELVAVLLRHGQAKLAEVLGESDASISQKINNGKGWKLEDLARALVYVGAQILPGDGTKTVVDTKELEATRTLAEKYLAMQNGAD